MTTTSTESWKRKREEQARHSYKGSLALGTALVLVGVSLLVGPLGFWREFWPVALIVGGLGLALSAVKKRENASTKAANADQDKGGN